MVGHRRQRDEPLDFQTSQVGRVIAGAVMASILRLLFLRWRKINLAGVIASGADGRGEIPVSLRDIIPAIF